MKEDTDLTLLTLSTLCPLLMLAYEECMFEQIAASVSFWLSAANMLLIACYHLVFDLTTYPTWVAADVCVRSVCTWLQVPADIFLFNPGKP